MKYLLDTHVFIWFIEGSDALPQEMREEITLIKNECYLSIASIWEIAIKCSIGKLELKSDFHEITDFLSDNNIKILPVEFHHLQTLLNLEFIHRDPFDRLIISQGVADRLTVMTADKQFESYESAGFLLFGKP